MHKFGKLPPKFHPKTLKLSQYLLGSALPPPLEKRAWEYVLPKMGWGFLGNDEVGDCVIAAMMHWIMAATANTGKPATFTTKEALSTYSAITGYDPSQTDALGNNPTDNGTAWTDALAYWQKTGITDTNGTVHKILGWASIDFSSIAAQRQGINIFGGTLIGTNVTSSMEDQFNAGQPWNSPFSNDSLGGHGIPWLGYGSAGQTCITWGQTQPMDIEALSQVDETYVPLTQDWIDAQGKSPSGFDLDALQKDLKLIAA